MKERERRKREKITERTAPLIWRRKSVRERDNYTKIEGESKK